MDKKNKWEFAYFEDIPVVGFDACQIGIITNGKRFLFYSATDDDKEYTCHLFTFLSDFLEGAECITYPWTADNDKLLLNTLNVNNCETLKDIEKILKEIKFMEYEEES